MAAKREDRGVELALRFGEHELTACVGGEFGLRVRGERGGLQFVPNIVDDRSVQVEVRRFDPGADLKAEHLEYERLDELHLDIGGEPLQVEFGRFDLVISAPDLCAPGHSSGGRCCVTCDNAIACACAVSMSCGSCCADPCC